MIEKILEKIQELIDESFSNSLKGYTFASARNFAYHECKKIVQEVAKEYDNEWIPCSERLPNREEYQKCNGQFIVSDGNRTYATYFDIYDTMEFGEPTIERFRIDKCVVAWQPLPTPYQKGE